MLPSTGLNLLWLPMSVHNDDHIRRPIFFHIEALLNRIRICSPNTTTMISAFSLHGGVAPSGTSAPLLHDRRITMHNSTTIVRAKRSRASCILSTFATVTHAYSYFFNKLCPWLGSTWCFDPALFKQSRDHYTMYLWFFYVMHVTPQNMYSWNLRPEQRQYASNSRCGTKPLSAFEILRHPLGCWSSLKTSSAGSSINQDTRSLLRCLLLPEAGTGHKRRASKRISEAPDAVPRELAPTGFTV